MTGRAWVRAYPDIQTAWRRLAAHLGENFDPTLTDFERLRRFLDQEWAHLHPHFYERSIGYLYDLTWFHYMDAKDGFFRTLLDFADEHGLSRIADLGCGVALDAQALLQAGYDVHAYDLDNPCLAYARWRLGHDLGESGRVRFLSELNTHHYQLVYAVDVLGHAGNPDALAALLFGSADHVAVNLLPHDSRHRFGQPTCTPASTTNAPSPSCKPTETSSE
ncbi:class I SAM-dependent methyltransferase [Planotetraspora sp. A-T 1434]|uniref:class I SAM-dependent methyltransferase n=1 Tax=Planotetraspora sp. A-T 1434 TaxID=2979219 RepID=UPI0021BFFCEB|nr:class I SAM-dependent methyltransferase [Planotetraspora sp. A-T 1434]MCT9934940.1 class I SAM-dependent methyltransferase [Planotetraspora sp. A-T 1434]